MAHSHGTLPHGIPQSGESLLPRTTCLTGLYFLPTWKWKGGAACHGWAASGAEMKECGPGESRTGHSPEFSTTSKPELEASLRK